MELPMSEEMKKFTPLISWCSFSRWSWSFLLKGALLFDRNSSTNGEIPCCYVRRERRRKKGASGVSPIKTQSVEEARQDLDGIIQRDEGVGGLGSRDPAQGVGGHPGWDTDAAINLRGLFLRWDDKKGTFSEYKVFSCCLCLKRKAGCCCPRRNLIYFETCVVFAFFCLLLKRQSK